MQPKSFWKLACLAGIAMTACFAQAETYALMIGINDYPDVLDKDGKKMKDETGNEINLDLYGAVNDIKKYQDILVNKYGVKPDNIKAVFDKDANEAGFIGGWKWVLEKLQPGDQLLFFYSGHGTQMEDKTEEDGKEEFIVLADNKVVAGDFFASLSKDLANANINSSIVFDSCYSGGMSRGDFSYDGKTGAARRRYVLPAVAEAAMKKVPLGQLEAVKQVNKAKPAQEKGGYAFLFAGQENQPTTDLDFKDPAVPDHGLFTLVMTTLIDAAPNAPLEDLLVTIGDFLKEKGFDQKPMFEYSSPERAKKPFILSN